MSEFDEIQNEEELNIITLTEEDGTEQDFEFLDLIEYEGKEYTILVPLEDDGPEISQVVILEVHPLDDDTEEYLGVEDDDILNKVFAIFKERFEEEFNFVD